MHLEIKKEKIKWTILSYVFLSINIYNLSSKQICE